MKTAGRPPTKSPMEVVNETRVIVEAPPPPVTNADLTEQYVQSLLSNDDQGAVEALARLGIERKCPHCQRTLAADDFSRKLESDRGFIDAFKAATSAVNLAESKVRAAEAALSTAEAKYAELGCQGLDTTWAKEKRDEAMRALNVIRASSHTASAMVQSLSAASNPQSALLAHLAS